MAFSDNVVLISGASRGIGLATAREFLAAGWRLSLGVRKPADLPTDLLEDPARVLVARYDAQDRALAEAWVAQTADTFGRIDALINNAGMNRRVTIETYEDEDIDLLWAVNVKGPLRLARLCLPHLEATGRGRIINVVSLSGKRVRNPHVGYSMTKFAVMGLTHTLRHVGWDKGVRTTAICPGFVRTDLTAYVTKIPHDQMTDPTDLAHLIRTTVELPNTAAIAELLVNCVQEDMI